MPSVEPMRVLIGRTDVGFVRERPTGRWIAWCRPAIAGRSQLATRDEAERWVRMTIAVQILIGSVT